jgi:hypothetical protein
MPTKAKPRQGSKVKTTSRPKDKYKSNSKYDTSKNLAVGGLIGLILFYIIGSRALDTGSYWEYLYSLIIIIITIRLFIRSLRLK